MVQVPSGLCTLVVSCCGFAPEGHTGLPDSKVGTSRGVGLKGRNTALEGFIVGLMSKFLNAFSQRLAFYFTSGAAAAEADAALSGI